MAETIKRNPASRLREILESALSMPPAVHTRHAWCKVFEISDPDSEEALLEVQSRLLSLRKLFTDTESALREMPDLNESLFVAPLHRLSKVINLNGLHHGWNNYINHLKTTDMFSLNFIEDLLNRNVDSRENEIPPDEIKALLVDLQELYEAVAASSLPKELKVALLDLIQEMLRGVHEYRVRGAVALKDILAKSIGVVAANKEAIDENRDSEEIQALGRMLTRLDKAYSFAMKMQPVLQAAANLFPALTAHIK